MNDFFVYKPKKTDEDAPPIVSERYLIICDGLHSTGSIKHEIDSEIKTSAYIGSRCLSNICKEYFEMNYIEISELMQMKNNNEDVTERIERTNADFVKYIKKELDEYAKEKELSTISCGIEYKGRYEIMPSTLSAIIYKEYDNYVDVMVFSAGDSRSYVLSSEKGLQQLSKDDNSENEDAYSSDVIMCNCVSQSSDFFINTYIYRINKPCILFSCSDGFYECVATPMHLEYIMDYFLQAEINILEEKNSYGENLTLYLDRNDVMWQDDVTVSGVILGYDDEEFIKKEFRERAFYLKEKYIDEYLELAKKKSCIDNCLNEEKTQMREQIENKQYDLWKKYKTNYEFFY